MKRPLKYSIIVLSIIVLGALILIYAGIYTLVFSTKSIDLLEGAATMTIVIYSFVRLILILADLLFGSKPIKFHFSIVALLFQLFIFNFLYMLAGPFGYYAITKPLHENFYLHFTLLLLINHFTCIYLLKIYERLKLKHLTKFSS